MKTYREAKPRGNSGVWEEGEILMRPEDKGKEQLIDELARIAQRLTWNLGDDNTEENRRATLKSILKQLIGYRPIASLMLSFVPC